MKKAKNTRVGVVQACEPHFTLLTSEGLLAVLDTSKAIDDEENMDTSGIPEDELLGHSDDDNITSFQILTDRKDNSKRNKPSATTTARTKPPDRMKIPENVVMHSQPGQPRKPGQTGQPRQPGQSGQPGYPAENRIFHAEAAIKPLKRHTDKGTCPESLQHRARARLRPDNDFKTDIKRIRKKRQTRSRQSINTLSLPKNRSRKG